jgi:acyl dehydratase
MSSPTAMCCISASPTEAAAMTLFFEDFAVGDTRTYGSCAVSADDIVAFASVFDAQDFHIDAAAAASTFVGGLIASGWHTSSLMMRMMCEGFLDDSAGMGAPGLEELKWLRPVRPGAVLSVRHTVLDVKESRSRRDIGLVRFRFEVLDQSGEAVQEVTNWIIFGRRGEVPPPAFRTPKRLPARYHAPSGSGPLEPPDTPPVPLPRFDDVVPGTRTELGRFTFQSADIIAFAAAYDPQRFHLDEAAAAASLFGGLCASGWHTGAIWMRLMVASRRRAEAAASGAVARLGSSPGFRNLKWLKPVFAGDTISYASTVADKRASASRPQWGLVFHQNTGHNQRGELVFSFDGCVFWER